MPEDIWHSHGRDAFENIKYDEMTHTLHGMCLEKSGHTIVRGQCARQGMIIRLDLEII